MSIKRFDEFINERVYDFSHPDTSDEWKLTVPDELPQKFDKIPCINNEGFEDKLTIGKEYLIVGYSSMGDTLWIFGDNGEYNYYPLKCFWKKSNEELNQKEPLTFKSKKNDLFYITFKFDEEGRLDKVDNKWDISFLDWWGLDVPRTDIINYFKDKYPEYYVEKLNEEFLGSGNQTTLPTDEEIAYELRELYNGSVTERTGLVEQRIKQLMEIHAKWGEMAKQHYNAGEIARKLFQYDINLNKR